MSLRWVHACSCIVSHSTPPPTPRLFPPRLIRISSHNLNYFIAVGAIILYVDIILSVIPTTNPDAVAVLCTLTPWLIAIGYSLCYGTVVVKMWRVAYIFNNPSPQMAKVQGASMADMVQ